MSETKLTRLRVWAQHLAAQPEWLVQWSDGEMSIQAATARDAAQCVQAAYGVRVLGVVRVARDERRAA